MFFPSESPGLFSVHHHDATNIVAALTQRLPANNTENIPKMKDNKIIGPTGMLSLLTPPELLPIFSLLLLLSGHSIGVVDIPLQYQQQFLLRFPLDNPYSWLGRRYPPTRKDSLYTNLAFEKHEFFHYRGE
jgi:hypothetical protein